MTQHINPTMPPPPPRRRTPTHQCNSQHSATPFFGNTPDPALSLSGIPIRPPVIPPIEPLGLIGSLSHVDRKILPANDSKSASRTYEALKKFNQRLLDNPDSYADYVGERLTNEALKIFNQRLLDNPDSYADYAKKYFTRLSLDKNLRNESDRISTDPTCAKLKQFNMDLLKIQRSFK